MKRIHFSLACCILSTVICPAQAQQWTLDECVNAALRNNAQLQKAQIDVEMAHEDRLGARTNYFPQVNAMGGAFVGAKDLMRSEMEFTMPGMGTMPVPISMIKKGVLTTLTALQPLYAGGQILNGNRLAALQEEVRTLQYELTRKDVILNVETYFWQLAGLRSNIQTLDAAEAQLAEVHRQTEQFLSAGLINRNDLLRVELKQREVQSQRLTLENGIEILRLLLSQLCGAQPETFDTAPSPLPQPTDPGSHFVSPDQALALREEVMLTEQDHRAHRLQEKIELGKRLPTLSVGASAIYYNVMEKNQGNLVGLATLSVPISDWWGGSHALRRARQSTRQSLITMQDTRQKLQIDLLASWNNLREAYTQTLLADESARQAAENLRLSRNQYEAGTLPLTDLLDAVTLHTQSHSQLAHAQADYQIRLAEYRRRTGNP